MAKGFLEGYKTYKPKEEGYGDSSQWKGAFNKRMGFEEANKILSGQNQSPFEILGLKADADFKAVKKAYRKLAIENHPDKHPTEQEKYTAIMQKINAAYVVLEKRFGKV